MRSGLVSVAALVLALLVAVPFGGAASRPVLGVQGMTVSGAPHAARAHHVRITIAFRYEMQCNYPGAGPLVVSFPSTVKLPKRFAPGSVRLSGQAVSPAIEGHDVTVKIPRHKGLLCDLMGPGILKLVFTRAAGLTNPLHAGTYRFTATHTTRTFRARLVVEPAG